MPQVNKPFALIIAAFGLALVGCVSMHGENSVLTPTGADTASSSAVIQGQTLYTSAAITLVKFEAVDSRSTARSTKNVTRTVIPAGAPGLVLGSGEGWMAVQFGSKDYLYFTEVENRLDGSRLNDERIAGRYYLYLPDWDGRAGTVTLNGSSWLAVDQSRVAYLLNDRDARHDQSLRSTSLCSRWLDERR